MKKNNVYILIAVLAVLLSLALMVFLKKGISTTSSTAIPTATFSPKNPPPEAPQPPPPPSDNSQNPSVYPATLNKKPPKL